MTRVHFKALLLACGAVALGFGVSASAQRARLELFHRIEPGHWQLHSGDGELPTPDMCLPSPRRLIQLRHPQLFCSNLVLTDQPDELTVQYTCPGRGYGRTTIRRETPSLIQIQTQGIAEGRPFDFSAEGRRVGDCAR